MIETREKIINGAVYLVTQLPARRALRLKAKLIKLFGPVLAQVFLAISENQDEDKKKADLVKAVEILGAHIDENSFELLIMELLQGVRKNNMELTAPTVDLEFAGDMASLYLVAWFVIEVNFANFFQLVGIGNLSSDTTPLPSQNTKKTFTKK